MEDAKGLICEKAKDNEDCLIIVSNGAKIRNRYNQIPHLTHDTNGKVKFNSLIEKFENTCDPKDRWTIYKHMTTKETDHSVLHLIDSNRDLVFISAVSFEAFLFKSFYLFSFTLAIRYLIIIRGYRKILNLTKKKNFWLSHLNKCPELRTLWSQL